MAHPGLVNRGERGELQERYREGEEEQLGAFGLVVSVIVLWKTIHMEAVYPLGPLMQHAG